MIKRGSALALLALAGMLAGCQSLPEKQVVVVYRETIQFHTYLQADGDDNPMGVLGFASYFTVSCIGNTGRHATDFTFDVRRIHLDTQTSENRAIAAHIPSTIPATGWTNNLLIADTLSVPAGRALAPAQPYAFVIAVDPSKSTDQGAVHALMYDAADGQSVVMRPDPDHPGPIYKWGADVSDFRIGRRIGTEEDPPRCRS